MHNWSPRPLTGLRLTAVAKGQKRQPDKTGTKPGTHLGQPNASIWPWVYTNYHQKWDGEHPNKDYYIYFWDVHQGYRVLTHTHMDKY